VIETKETLEEQSQQSKPLFITQLIENKPVTSHLPSKAAYLSLNHSDTASAEIVFPIWRKIA